MPIPFMSSRRSGAGDGAPLAVRSDGETLRMEHLNVTRRDERVLEGLNFSLSAGGSAAIVGASGAGKTTLLHCVAGLVAPDSGVVVCEGRDVTGLTVAARRAWRLARCGLVFQFGELLPELTLRENAELPLRLLGASTSTARKRVSELFARVGIAEVADRVPSRVSGGQMQRAAIVRALAHRPAVVLADEPTGALDTRSSTDVVDLLRGVCNEAGAALLVATHDEQVAAAMDRRLALVEGALRPVPW